MIRRPPTSPPFPSPPLSRPRARWPPVQVTVERALQSFARLTDPAALAVQPQRVDIVRIDRRTTMEEMARQRPTPVPAATLALDRKSTRLNSSHLVISYAVFC